MCQVLLLHHLACYMQKGLHLIMQLLNSTWYSHQYTDLWYNHQYMVHLLCTQCVIHLARIQCRGWDTHYSKNPVSTFPLCFITGNITTCFGCKNKYPKQPQAPYDLCIKHQEWWQFMSPSSATPQSKFGNAYFHCQLQCVWMRHPNFVASDVQVHIFLPR